MFHPKGQIKLDTGWDSNIDFYPLLINTPAKFEKLFKGYRKLRAVTWVGSPELILKFFDDQFGFEEIELVVGDKLVDSYHNSLVSKNVNVTEEILKKIQEGNLTIYGSDRPLHTKLYILEDYNNIRIIQGSANLTKEARKAHQINTVDVFDIQYNTPMSDEILSSYESIYQEHLEHGLPFMGDLIQKINEDIDSDADEIIQLWLQNTVSNTDASNRDFFGNMGDEALLSDETGTEMKFTIQGSLSSKKHQKKVLKNFNSEYVGDAVRVDRRTYLDQRNHAIPVMKYFPEKNNLIIGLNGERIQLSRPLSEPEIIDAWLSNLEGYVNCVDFGNAPTPETTKMYMMEALMYLFSAPFANQYLDIRRRNVGEIDKRGPRFLYIYGDSQNGKTTFLSWILKLMIGERIDPISGKELSYDYIMNARDIGTAFPLMFDDVPGTKWRGKLESFFKNYWETEWRPQDTFPQVIFTSNRYSLPKWANTRLKRVEFDVQFINDPEAKRTLNSIYREENKIFGDFATMYIGLLKQQKDYHEDELALARKVFELLYNKAERTLPGYFPLKPAEELHNPARTRWQNLIDYHKKAKLKRRRKETHITFSNDMDRRSINECRSLLPQDIKHRLEGNLLIIQTPERFDDWLNNGKKKSKWIFWR